MYFAIKLKWFFTCSLQIKAFSTICDEGTTGKLQASNTGKPCVLLSAYKYRWMISNFIGEVFLRLGFRKRTMWCWWSPGAWANSSDPHGWWLSPGDVNGFIVICYCHSCEMGSLGKEIERQHPPFSCPKHSFLFLYCQVFGFCFPYTFPWHIQPDHPSHL